MQGHRRVFGLLIRVGRCNIDIRLIIGTKKTSRFNSVLTGINLFVILFVVGVRACYAEPKNWSDFIPTDSLE